MLNPYVSLLIVVLASGVITLSLFAFGWLQKDGSKSPEKLMPFEGGNDSEGAKGVRPIVKFYRAAILFLVFDAALLCLFPWAIVFKQLGLSGLLSGASFIVSWLIALVYCLKKGALQWDP